MHILYGFSYGGLIAKSCPTLGTPRTVAYQAVSLWDSPGKNTGVGCHFLLHGIFLTQGLNWGLLYCRWILHRLSHQGCPCLGNEHKKFPTFFFEVSTSILNLTRVLDGLTTVHMASLRKAASDVASYPQHIQHMHFDIYLDLKKRNQQQKERKGPVKRKPVVFTK